MPENKKPITRDDDAVKLKPILGIRPGIYLALLYGTILLAVIFFTLFYPGIKNPGIVMMVHSEPGGAAVFVDGVYAGAAPADIFIRRGNRNIEISLPGFASKTVNINAGSRIFASLIFPKKIEIRESLTAIDFQTGFLTEAAQFSGWTFTGEPSTIYQIPQTLSEAVYRFAHNQDIISKIFFDDMLLASARFAVTRASLRDLLRAKLLLDNKGLSPSPLSLLSSANDIINYLNNNLAALWLADVLTGEELSILRSSAWYRDAASIMSANQSTTGQITYSVQIGFMTYHYVNGRVFSDSWVDSFYIADSVINERSWEQFLQENPQWRKENIESLVLNGLVTDEYLETMDVMSTSQQGISGISWHSATAFCTWLTASLPAGLSGWEVRLPTETEWELAYYSGLENTGQFWEWNNDFYAPLNFLNAPEYAVNALGSPERSLRGGSWINPAGTIRAETRASLPPEFCSPFVSARPVIVQVRNNP